MIIVQLKIVADTPVTNDWLVKNQIYSLGGGVLIQSEYQPAATLHQTLFDGSLSQVVNII